MANIREICLNILMEYDRDDGKRSSLLKDALNKYDYLETRDKAFIKKVVDGCIERQIQLDYVINLFAKTLTDRQQPLIRSTLRMGTYQIMFMEQIPDSAACNEAVKLASKHGFTNLKGFVNGVLRSISRNKDNIEYPDKELDDGLDFLSVYYSMPEWICRMWLDRFGFDATKKMLEFFLEPRPTVIRTAARIYEKEIEDFIRQLEGAGAVVKKNPVLPYALELTKTDNLRFLPGYDEGYFMVQDVSSMLVTEIAEPKEGDIVIDVCAAPGGKSIHTAEKCGDIGRVISRDVSDKKCSLIAENAERMGIKNIEITAHDAREKDDSLVETADILYLDVPCSGVGIIGRKSDIKYNVTPQGIEELNDLQWEIVNASWSYVKKGGIMMYSTCTVNAKENEDMVRRICSELPFEPAGFSDKLPECMKNEKTAKDGFIQLIPGKYGTDGFFIAKLRRK